MFASYYHYYTIKIYCQCADIQCLLIGLMIYEFLSRNTEKYLLSIFAGAYIKRYNLREKDVSVALGQMQLYIKFGCHY